MEREGHCYCGKERNLNICELLCASCLRWYHESCISYQLGKLVPFMMNYNFVCKNCSPTGLESFKKIQATFPQICITALGNLVQASIKDGKQRNMFNKDTEMIPFIDCHWESMTTMPRRVTHSWHMTILRALTKETGNLFKFEDSAEGSLYGLVNLELTQIRPTYDTMGRGAGSRQNEMASLKGRTKRKLPTDCGGVVKKGRSGGFGDAVPKLPAHGYPLEHPHNKDGYRYILAEPDPHAPFRQEFDESPDWAGKPIPPWLYRAVIPSTVLLALHDRAPQMKVSEDRVTCTGDKGYCMLRATHAVSRGVWYWEATIDDLPEGGATRIGWTQEYANLQAPVGYDKFGYSWRSLKGTKFHESRGKHYSEGYTVGDVLGFLILLPESRSYNYLPQTYKKARPLVKFKSHLYYEEKDQLAEALKALRPLKGSKIIFYKNGICQGVAFQDIYQGGYYPAVSLYKSTVVNVNFGPHFKHPPDCKFRGMFEKSEEAIVEQTTADILFLTENHGLLKLDL